MRRRVSRTTRRLIKPRRSRQAQTVMTRSDQRAALRDARGLPGAHHATAAMWVATQMEAGEQLAEPDAIHAGKRPDIRRHLATLGPRRLPMGCWVGLDEDQKRTGSR
jgi:hypothetical protein